MICVSDIHTVPEALPATGTAGLWFTPLPVLSREGGRARASLVTDTKERYTKRAGSSTEYRNSSYTPGMYHGDNGKRPSGDPPDVSTTGLDL